jgi:hypothetical protein
LTSLGYPENTSRRAQVVADAVVSAYINEIARPASARRPGVTAPQSRRPAPARPRGSVQARRRRAHLVL